MNMVYCQSLYVGKIKRGRIFKLEQELIWKNGDLCFDIFDCGGGTVWGLDTDCERARV